MKGSLEVSDTNVKYATTPLRWANWAKSGCQRFCAWPYSLPGGC